MAKKNLNEMSFLDHLEELRWLLVKSTIAILVMATVTFFVSDFIFNDVIFGPTKADFITYQLFCDLSHQLGFADSICVTDMAFIIQNTNMEGQINILVWTCITAGFILAFPFILWQIWQFISPALYEKEKSMQNCLSLHRPFFSLWGFCLATLSSYLCRLTFLRPLRSAM